MTDKTVPFVRWKEAAPDCDAVSLQLQRAQLDPEMYPKLTRQYVSEIREANPKTIVFVQVTSREKSGKKPSAADLMEPIRSVADVVDGIWIHVEKDEPEFATELVMLMGKAGYRGAGE